MVKGLRGGEGDAFVDGGDDGGENFFVGGLHDIAVEGRSGEEDEVGIIVFLFGFENGGGHVREGCGVEET